MPVINLTIEQVLSFGIRLSDGKPFIATTNREFILPRFGDYQTIKRDCLESGLFTEATQKVKHLHLEAYIRI